MTGRFEDTHKITKKDLQAAYSKLGSLREVGREYGTDHSVIKRMMDRFGLIYNLENTRALGVNHSFFSNYSPVTYYWAGFMAADGCIHGKYIRLTLAEKDREHLNLFRSDLSSKHKISQYTSEGSVCYGIAISSQQMVDNLVSFGVVPRKTHILDFPDIPEEMLPSFCRGYFDGDGCWCFHRPSSRPNRKPQLVFSTRGTSMFLKGMNRAIVERAGLPERCLEKCLNGWRTSVLQYNGNAICTKIAQWLYSDISSSRYLRRKFDVVSDRL